MPAIRRVAERSFGALILVAIFATGCLQTTPQLIKIGLIAPFEGRYREVGNDVVPAVRLAIREWAVMHPNEAVTVELVTYDDRGDPTEAITQAERLLTDTAIDVVIGHWRQETTLAAAPIYDDADIPLITFVEFQFEGGISGFNLAPDQTDTQQFAERYFNLQSLDAEMELDASLVVACTELQGKHTIGGSEWGLSQFRNLHDCADDLFFVSGFTLPQHAFGAYWDDNRRVEFERQFREGSLGAPPGLMSIAAYEATWLALSLVVPVSVEIPVDASQFDESGHRDSAPIYLYQWVDGTRELIDISDFGSPPTQ